MSICDFGANVDEDGNGVRCFHILRSILDLARTKGVPLANVVGRLSN